jgi:hypothetical protein
MYSTSKSTRVRTSVTAVRMSSALFKMLSLVSFADSTDDMAASRTSSLDTCSVPKQLSQ